MSYESRFETFGDLRAYLSAPELPHRVCQDVAAHVQWRYEQTPGEVLDAWMPYVRGVLHGPGRRGEAPELAPKSLDVEHFNVDVFGWNAQSLLEASCARQLSVKVARRVGRKARQRRGVRWSRGRWPAMPMPWIWSIQIECDDEYAPVTRSDLEALFELDLPNVRVLSLYYAQLDEGAQDALIEWARGRRLEEFYAEGSALDDVFVTRLFEALDTTAMRTIYVSNEVLMTEASWDAIARTCSKSLMYLMCAQRGFGEGAPDALVAHGPWERLVSLEIWTSPLSATSLSKLLESGAFVALESLVLECEGLDARLARAIGASSGLPSLTDVDLTSSRVDPFEDVGEVFESAGEGIRSLHVGREALPSQSLAYLLGLPRLSNLRELEIVAIPDARGALRALAASPAASSLESLSFSLDLRGALAELTRAELSSLRSLRLKVCEMDREAYRILSHHLSLPRLESLEIVVPLGEEMREMDEELLEWFATGPGLRHVSRFDVEWAVPDLEDALARLRRRWAELNPWTRAVRGS